MKKMLITGTSGFLGSKVAAFYKGTYEILAPSHSMMDITEEESVNRYFLEKRPDIVIHCAAISDTGTCEREKELSWKINVTGSENIAKAAKMVSAKCILCSSDQVYCASDSPCAHKEDETVYPSNTYGKEKLCAEANCLKINEESVHLRLAWMYDAKDEKFARRNDFAKQLRDSVRQSKELSFMASDKRGITDVWEVVKNIEKTLELPGGVYNFGAPNERSTYETAIEILKTLGYDTSLIHKTEQMRERNLTMSQEKVNAYNIYFTPTIERAVQCLKELSLS